MTEPTLRITDEALQILTHAGFTQQDAHAMIARPHRAWTENGCHHIRYGRVELVRQKKQIIHVTVHPTPHDYIGPYISFPGVITALTRMGYSRADVLECINDPETTQIDRTRARPTTIYHNASLSVIVSEDQQILSIQEAHHDH